MSRPEAKALAVAVAGLVVVATAAILFRRMRKKSPSKGAGIPGRVENVVWSGTLRDIPSDKVTLVVDAAYLLAEGLVWCHRTGVLWWVDIEGRRICRMKESPVGKLEAVSWDVPVRPGSLALRNNATLPLLVAFEDAFSFYNPETCERVPVEEGGGEYVQVPESRLNDGRCDRVGRFVCGAINLRNIDMPLDVWEARVGAYRVEPRGGGQGGSVVRGILPDLMFRCYNGTCFSPKGDIMYCTDSPTRQVLSFDYDSTSGTISNRVVLFELKEGEGVADGATTDADGCLWVAVFGAGEVRRYSSQGRLLKTIPLPLANKATCVTIGGPDLDILFICTACVGLSDVERLEQTNAGGIFAIRLDKGCVGLPEPIFNG
ncbi:unnamed protein product [Discosporangium mesarthrocarpum]